jgi:hypothetical protein
MARYRVGIILPLKIEVSPWLSMLASGEISVED